MEHKSFQLDEKSLEQLVKLNMSIAHQSVNIVRIEFQAEEMRRGVAGLYAAQKQLLYRVAQNNGIQAKDISDINVDETGKVTVEYNTSNNLPSENSPS